MPSPRVNLLPFLALAIFGAALTYAVSFGTLRRADFTFTNGTEVKSLDPAKITGQPEGRIANALFEGLTNRDPRTLEPVPGVAERWEISPDGRTYTFHLRDNARWSDGSPVTADDFVYSFNRTLNPLTQSEYSYQLWYIQNAKKYNSGAAALAVGDPVEVELRTRPEKALPNARGTLLHGKLTALEEGVFVVEIDGRPRRFTTDEDLAEEAEWCEQILLDFREVGVKALDPRTLQITLNEPTPFFLGLTGFYPLFPVNQRCVEKYGYPEWIRPENIVSNGAFSLQERRIRDRIRMVKNPHYWNRDAVRLESVDALAVESDITALNLYLTGEVDWIPRVTAAVIPDLQKQQRDDFSTAPYLTVEFLRVNTRKPPLDDPRVRKALALAINRQELVDIVTQAGEQPAFSLVPPGMPGYDPPQFGKYDPEAARKLLAEAGYPGGRGFPKIDLLYNASNTAAAMAQLVQAQWEDELGIEIAPRQEEWNSYLTSQQIGQYYLSRAGWVGDYVDPNTFLDMFLTDGANNQTGWSNPKFDALIQRAKGEQDPQQRLATLREAEQMLLDEMPIIPMFFGVSKNLVRPYVRGFYPNIQDEHPLEALSIDPEAKARFAAEGELR